MFICVYVFTGESTTSSSSRKGRRKKRSKKSRSQRNKKKREAQSFNIRRAECAETSGGWKEVIKKVDKRISGTSIVDRRLEHLIMRYGSRNNNNMAELSKAIMVPPINGAVVAHSGKKKRKSSTFSYCWFQHMLLHHIQC